MLDNVLAALTRALEATIWPFYEFLIDGNSRYFWLYCVTGFLISTWVQQRRTPEAPHKASDILFARETWLSRSAINDYVIMMLGSFLRLTIFAWVVVTIKPFSHAVVDLIAALGVKGQALNGPAILGGLALTIALFLVDDACKFFAHYLGHKVPELWEYHKVHHSAEVLNFITAERFHPVVVIVTTIIVGLGVGLVIGVFVAFFGNTLTPVTVFGANVFLVALNVFGGVLRHSPMWISFGPAVERWIMSPAMHQIHHSEDPRHYDANLGVSLSVWDRMAGTLYLAKDPAEVKGYGIGAETRDFRSLAVIYFRPFTASYAVLKNRIAGGFAVPRLDETRS
jgi:sterol desaturase/sphingolipid hydroxylase (fatty acid hydroxylase superfamily)